MVTVVYHQTVSQHVSVGENGVIESNGLLRGSKKSFYINPHSSPDTRHVIDRREHANAAVSHMMTELTTKRQSGDTSMHIDDIQSSKLPANYTREREDVIRVHKEIAEQKEAEAAKEIAEQKEAEAAKEIAEQKEAEAAKEIAEQKEAEAASDRAAEEIAEQKEAKAAKEIAEQKEAEEAKEIAEQMEAEAAKKIAEQKGDDAASDRAAKEVIGHKDTGISKHQSMSPAGVDKDLSEPAVLSAGMYSYWPHGVF